MDKRFLFQADESLDEVGYADFIEGATALERVAIKEAVAAELGYETGEFAGSLGEAGYTPIEQKNNVIKISDYLERKKALIIETGIISRLPSTETLIEEATVVEPVFSLGELASVILAPSAALLVAALVNSVRQDRFNENRDDIAGYQWSAILDAATCPRCEELDGTIFRPDDPALAELGPQLHGNCRCILVVVMKEEADQYEEDFEREIFDEVLTPKEVEELVGVGPTSPFLTQEIVDQIENYKRRFDK